ncbi:MAG: hypothetical protein IH571_05450 [Acholeplasmataceae bacterium]|nr:hypothetical protein [Acholeplasmataceae bacterium]
MSNHLRLKKMLYMVSLAAISIVLSLIEIPWFIATGPFAGFLKLDFSEVAILISLFVLGTKETIGVVLIRTIARRLFRGFEIGDMVGEMLAMFASFAIIFGYNLAKKILGNQEKPLLYEVSINGNKTSKKDFFVYTSFITISLTIFLLIVNFLIATPIYLSLYGFFHTGDNVSFTVFHFVQDSPLSMLTFFWFCFISYTPFNLTKGILVSFIFLFIKPRMKYLEL